MCPLPDIIYITEIDELGRKMFTMQEDRIWGFKPEVLCNELSEVIMELILHIFSLDILIISYYTIHGNSVGLNCLQVWKLWYTL